ncbi:MAG: beta-phosphoglucomutase family hydrolase [Candidatus Lokiarchaeota archaeon]|nr:beta-phosphoglucomutase family hydrolase [Candidatus Lokiarchaeota archaeon]MBD3202156.1 beta-phosphoglucomutase family hydrolase [Candidatus Lokiarchaeota archaeon]
MYEYYCVIFDFDGVIADTGPIHYRSWKKLAEELNVEYDTEFFEETFGQQTVPIVKKMVSEEITNEKAQKLGKKKEQYYRDMLGDDIQPLPGVKVLIKALHKLHFKLAIGSSAPRKNIDLLLKSLDLNNFFDIIIAAEDIKNGKPAPDVFLTIAKDLKLNQKNCLVIEDAPVGIKAAKIADMKTIALTTTHEEEKLKDADMVLKDLSEIDYNEIIKLLKND